MLACIDISPIARAVGLAPDGYLGNTASRLNIRWMAELDFSLTAGDYNIDTGNLGIAGESNTICITSTSHERHTKEILICANR
jgi:hypothetical protein